jgi:hypothetical protein
MRGFVAVITSLAFMGSVANADDSCTGAIVNSGPGSENSITCVDSTKVHVTCSNNIYVVNNSEQIAESGDATNGGNTTGGGSISGNATNENGATVEIGASCAGQPAAVTPENPTPSQPVGGMGAGGMGAGAPTEATQAITTLPNTGSNVILDSVLIGGTSLGALLIASRLGAVAYRRLALR